MATIPVYTLKILGNQAIDISQDELRTLLGEIEAELHRSKVYRRALATMQKLLGSSSEQANILFKAIGREAIGIAFRQFAQESEKANQHSQQLDDNIPSKTPSMTPTDVTELSQYITNSQAPEEAIAESTQKTDLPSDPLALGKTTQQKKPEQKKITKWLNPNRKLSRSELAKQTADQQRVESLHKIGEQLQQARESQGFSLSQLNVYTHIPIHQMEAIETGNWQSLPEEVFVRGFIRVMGNALGLNGTALAASLPTSEPVKAVLPSWYHPKNRLNLGMGLRPVHLYLGYTALVAGSLGGLSLLSQQASADRLINENVETPSPSSITQSLPGEETTHKPGLQSSQARITIGPDISPPEAL